ncbi:28835_t:CDS:1, partial [Racocetra persica]
NDREFYGSAKLYQYMMDDCNIHCLIFNSTNGHLIIGVRDNERFLITTSCFTGDHLSRENIERLHEETINRFNQFEIYIYYFPCRIGAHEEHFEFIKDSKKIYYVFEKKKFKDLFKRIILKFPFSIDQNEDYTETLSREFGLNEIRRFVCRFNIKFKGRYEELELKYFG